MTNPWPLTNTNPVNTQRSKALRRRQPQEDASAQELMYSLPYQFQDAGMLCLALSYHPRRCRDADELCCLFHSVLRAQHQSSRKLKTKIHGWYQWRTGTDRRQPKARSAAAAPSDSASVATASTAAASNASFWGSRESFVGRPSSEQRHSRHSNASASTATTTQRRSQTPRQQRPTHSYAESHRRKQQSVQGHEETRSRRASRSGIPGVDRSTGANADLQPPSPRRKLQYRGAATPSTTQRTAANAGAADVQRMVTYLQQMLGPDAGTNALLNDTTHSEYAKDVPITDKDSEAVKGIFEDAILTADLDLTPYLSKEELERAEGK